MAPALFLKDPSQEWGEASGWCMLLDWVFRENPTVLCKVG